MCEEEREELWLEGGGVCFVYTDDYVKQLCAKVAELEAKLAEYQNLEPVCYIPDDAIAQLQPPRIRLLSVPLITYHGENHTPLYALEK